jgi:hypothetical protein
MTMNIHRARPACYLTTEPTPRGQVSEGWKDGAKPGMRNPFWMEGRICGQAISRETWQWHLELTPGCRNCTRGRTDDGTELAWPRRPVQGTDPGTIADSPDSAPEALTGN